jgi:hypothetical protein
MQELHTKELHTMLRGDVTSRLHLPASTFAPLTARATDLPVGDALLFSTHATFDVPLEARPECSAALVHVVHRFVVQPRLGTPLNAELAHYARGREADFRERQRVWKARCDADPELAESEARTRWRKPSGEDLTVKLSNQGGFQSQHDLFQDDACKPCRELRAIVILPCHRQSLPRSAFFASRAGERRS